MRHLGSLVLSLVLGASSFVLLCVSGTKWFYSSTTADFGGSSGTTTHWTAVLIALVTAIGAGVVLAPLILARLSPVGPVLVGLAFVVVSLWGLFAPANYAKTVPASSFGVAGVWFSPATSPILLIAAIPLLATIFSPRRWRRWGNAPAAVAPPPGYAPPPAMAGSPAYPTSGAPGYPVSGAPGYPSATSGAPSYPGAATSGAPGYPGSTPAPGYPGSTPAPGYPGSPAPATPGYPPPLPPPAPVNAYGAGYQPPTYTEPAPGSYAAPGSPVGFPPPPDPFDDPEATRRL